MGVVFGGQSCQDPVAVLGYCQDQGLPVNWAGLPNRFMASVGPQAGRGWLLMRLNELNALNKNSLLDLTFTDNSGGAVTVKQLVFVNGDCVTPSYTGSTDAVYLVDVRDARHLAQNEFYGNPAFVMYNVRAPGGSQTYYAESLKTGSPWTWQQMLDDLWNNWVAVPELGPSPQLTASPNGTPEGFRFWGVPAWKAYNEVLARLGYAFQLDPTTSTSGAISQFGAADTSLTSAEGRLNSVRQIDDYSIEGVRGKVPSQIIVCFQKVYLAYGAEPTTIAAAGNWAADPLHRETVSTGAPSGTEGGSTAVLFDDLPALVNFDGTLANSAALTSRATERGADYFRSNYTGGSRMRRTYIGIHRDAGILPGLQVSGVGWRDTGTGFLTELVRYPPPLAPDDRGGWKVSPRAAEQLAPPDLARQSFPLYPPLTHPVAIVNTTTTPNVYDANLQRANPATPSLSTVEACWVYAPNGLTLTTGNVYNGRLIGPGTYTSSGGGGAVQRPTFFVEGLAGGVTFSGAYVVRTTNQSIPSGAITAVVFDTLLTGPVSYWTVSPNPSRVTVPTTGKYLFSSWLGFAAGSGSGSGVDFATSYIRVNGSAAYQMGSNLGLTSTNFFPMTGTVLLALAAGDYVEIVVLHNNISSGNASILEPAPNAGSIVGQTSYSVSLAVSFQGS